jgi:RNA polymerase sigma-70 factor (ECF subfamily)
MSSSAQTDQMLIRAYLGGEEIALQNLIKKHQRQVFTFISLKLKDRFLAEDIFQETFIKVVDCLRAGSYKEEGKFLPWTLRIAHNLCIDHFRKLKRNPKIVDNEGNDLLAKILIFEETYEDKIVKQQTYSSLKTFVIQLPKEQREVVVLRHYAELSFKEISEMTGVSINTALGRMRYALINLRKMMKESLITI